MVTQEHLGSKYRCAKSNQSKKLRTVLYKKYVPYSLDSGVLDLVIDGQDHVALAERAADKQNFYTIGFK